MRRRANLSGTRDGDAEVHVDETYTLVLAGHPLAAQDRRVLEAFAAQATVALRQERLEQAAATAGSRRGGPRTDRAAECSEP